MVHDPILPLLTALAHLGRYFAERLFPAYTLPLALAALSDSLQRVEDAFGIISLVVGGGTFGAVSAAAAGMDGVAFKLLDLQRRLVYIGQQAARALAVEADGGDEHVAVGNLARPLLAAVFDPVIPIFGRRVLAEAASGCCTSIICTLPGSTVAKSGRDVPAVLVMVVGGGDGRFPFGGAPTWSMVERKSKMDRCSLIMV